MQTVYYTKQMHRVPLVGVTSGVIFRVYFGYGGH